MLALAMRFYEKENRESFIRAFALSRGFDPLVATNWYSVSSHDINKNKVINLIFVIILKLIIKREGLQFSPTTMALYPGH